MTLEQQGYYWAAVIPAAAEGLSRVRRVHVTRQWIHEEFKIAFLTCETFDQNTGEITGEKVGSTMNLTVGQMVEYINKIEAYLKQFNIPLPPATPKGVRAQMKSRRIAYRSDAGVPT